MTRTTSAPARRLPRPGLPAERAVKAVVAASKASVAARAAERAVSGRRAPGIATTTGESSSSQASATSAESRRASATSARPGGERGRPPRGPPSGECAITATPASAQRSTTPPRTARSSNGLSATCTAAIGASSSASSNWRRLTFDSPTRRTSPSSTSRARARTEVRQGVRGSGACTR